MSDPQDPRTKLAAEMEQLRSRYLERLELDRAELAQLAAGLSGSEADRQAIGELHQRLHKLAGSAGTFGFDAIGDRARHLEEIAQEWLDLSLDGLDQASLKSFIDAVKRLGTD